MCPDTTIYAGGLEGCIVTVDYICVLNTAIYVS